MTWTAFRSHGREPFEPATEDWPSLSLEDPLLDAKIEDEMKRRRRIATKKAEEEAEHGDNE